MNFFTKTIFFLAFTVYVNTINAAVIRSIANGNWNSTLSWDLGRTPLSTDTVIVEAGFDLTITESTTCARLEIYNDAGLIVNLSTVNIDNGDTLNVTGDMIISTTISGILQSGIDVYVEGVLNVDGNVTMNNTLALLAATNLFQIGTASNSGKCTIKGDVTLDNSLTVALGYVNELVVANGDLTIEGNITQTSGLLNLLGTNHITINDNGAFDGTTKNIYFKGSLIDNDAGEIDIKDANSNTTFGFHYGGTSAQALQTDNITYHDVFISNSQYVYLESSPTNALVEGQFIISNGGVLLLDNVAYNLDNLSGSSDKIKALDGSRYKITEAAFSNAMPPASVSEFDSLSYVEFNNTSGSAHEVFAEQNNYPIVQLTGSGEKQYKTSGTTIDNSTSKVGRLEALEGTFTIESGLSLVLNDTYGDKVFFVDSAITIVLEGDFVSLDAFGDFHRYSTFSYEEDGTAQAISAFSQADGVTPEPYGILNLVSATGSSVDRTVGNTLIQIENRLDIGDEIELILNGTGHLQLLSDANYTAYVSEIPSTASINYNSTGRFIVGKFLEYTEYSSVELATSVDAVSLNSWKSQGVVFRGFPGSNSPGATWSNTVYYVEADSGTADMGFYAPSSITDSVTTFDGSGNINRNSYRINIGSANISLTDTGKVLMGTKIFNVTFNYSNSGPSSREDNDGWNLFGNPFPSAISWKKVVDDPENATLFDNGLISKQIYMYKYNDREDAIPADSDAFGYYHAGTGFEYAQDSLIPSSQGFIIKAYHDSATSKQTYQLRIKESHKVGIEETTNYKSMKMQNGNPRETALGIWLEQNRYGYGVIFAHPWKKATLGYDKDYDIKKVMGRGSSQTPSLDFTTTNYKELNLNVNAFDEDLNYLKIPFMVKTNDSCCFTLKLSNLDLYTSQYGCVSLYSPTLNRVFSVSETDTVINFNSNTDKVYFVLDFFNPLSFDIEASNISCFNESDGEVWLGTDDVDLDGYSFTLFREGDLWGIQNNELNFTYLTPGDYKLVSNRYFNGCESNEYTFTISQPQDIIASTSFGSEDTIEIGTSVSFSASSSQDLSYYWDVDGHVYSGENIAHRFTSGGKKQISLQMRHNTTGCSKYVNRNLYVQNTTNVSDYEWQEQAQFYYAEDQLHIYVPIEGATLTGYNYLGQETMKEKVQSKKATIPFKEKGLHLFKLTYGNMSKSLKVVR